MPTATVLSEAALALFRLHVDSDGIRVDDSNRDAHRELAGAGIMEPVSSFVAGPEAFYRFTEQGWARRDEWLARPAGEP